MLRRAVAAMIAVALAPLASCTQASFELVLSYPDQSTLDRARLVQVYVGAGQGCAALGRQLPAPRASYDPRGEAPALGAVAFGLASFLAVVSDADCVRLADGCTEQELRRDERASVRIVLESAGGSICQAHERCETARCVAVDGGLDAGPSDVARDGARDAAPGFDRAAVDGPAVDVVASDTLATDRPQRDVTIPDATTVDTAGADTVRVDSATADAARADSAAADSSSRDAGVGGPAHVYRSVGPGSTTALYSGAGNAMTVTDGLAVFNSGLPRNIGVGDVIQYDADGSAGADNLLFVHERRSARQFYLRAADGRTSAPDLGPLDRYSVFRAYTSLADFFTGSENSGLDPALHDVDGCCPDLVALDQVRHAACYADGVDMGPVDAASWTTGAANYVRVFTPHLASEVGLSQRHAGVWADSGAYTYRSTAQYVEVRINHARFEGIQFDVTNSGNDYSLALSAHPIGPDAVIDIGGNLFRGHFDGTGIEHFGAEVWDTVSSTLVRVHDNVFWGFTGSAIRQNGFGCYASATVVADNNTFIGVPIAIYNHQSRCQIVARNNLFAGCPLAVGGSIAAGTDYNATDQAAFGYNPTAGTPPHDRAGVTFTFVSASSSNFHLAPADTGGRDLGDGAASTSTHDIDGQPRPCGAGWDVGADEVCP